MKISAGYISELRLDQPVSRKTTPRATAQPAVLVTVNETLSEMRHLTRTQPVYGEVRPDVVNQIRRELKAGTFGGAADVDRAVDALLREF